ncbi:MAG: UbiX family flavin prenyltransferase [Alphaproteobacteria bacterium]|nr:UbiX family flavin prenyltransferase [Alphaproteobacteria bacterium]MDE2109923.1 UbiX family flavin prenyltransferase [Alphaproteobacteria bacterium]MDE2492648.1 UbiX family flavin prenyltransferase [Alphaproteobacteria bacterium]
MRKITALPASKDRLIVGISGASGVVYGIRLLEALKELGIESHLVVSKAAQLTMAYETSVKPKAVEAKADFAYAAGDIGASIASGSFRTRGMVVAPCSVRTMSEIATGVTTTLLSRAADVVLKERRTLVLMVRETPLHLGHLRTMTALSEMGAIIMPPVPAFYAAPNTLEDLVDHTIGRTLDCFGYNWPKIRRWSDGAPRGAGPKKNVK